MAEESNKAVRIPKSRVVFAYVMCAFGASFGLIDDYIEIGYVEASTIAISLLAFGVGVAIVSFVLYRLKRTGKFMHYDLNSPD